MKQVTSSQELKQALLDNERVIRIEKSDELYNSTLRFKNSKWAVIAAAVGLLALAPLSGGASIAAGAGLASLWVGSQVAGLATTLGREAAMKLFFSYSMKADDSGMILTCN